MVTSGTDLYIRHRDGCYRNSQHVAIIWIQVAQPRLLLLTLSGVLAQTLSTLAILGDEGEEVHGA